MFYHEDMYGRVMDIGDIVLVVGTGGAKAVPDLLKGRVVRTTKTMLIVQPLDQHNNPLMREEGYMENYGPPMTRSYGTHNHTYYARRWVKTGEVEREPLPIQWQVKRFYILEKI